MNGMPVPREHGSPTIPPIPPPNHATRNAPLLRTSRQTSPPFPGHVSELALSAAAPFVATHPPLIANRLSILDSSRRVEPWRVGECSLTCEGRFFVVMHRTAIVLPQPMAVVQIEEVFLQLIDSQDFFSLVYFWARNPFPRRHAGLGAIAPLFSQSYPQFLCINIDALIYQ